MTVKDFKEKNSDVILDELKWDDLPNLACGANLFYMSLANKTGQQDDKTILYAGHVMTTGMCGSDEELLLVRLTAHGHAKLDSITRERLEADKSAMLFHTRPMAKDDPRITKPWNQWP